jgi:long-chain acyl-CoA synthetase
MTRDEQGAWALDLDGSLVDLLTSTSLRPGARELITLLCGAGVRVVLWSAGGSGYAQERARRLGLAPYVSAYYDKVRSGPERPWHVDHMSPADRPSVCVDDQPEYCPPSARVIAVRPYISQDASDTGLAAAFEAAERWVQARRR